MAGEGMPKVGRGLFPLKACVQWYVGYWRDRAGGRIGNEAKARKDVADAALAEAKLKRQLGEVFDRQEVMDTWRGAFDRLAKALETLPTTLGREFNMTGEDVKLMRERVDEMRNAYVRDCKEFKDTVETDGDRSNKAA